MRRIVFAVTILAVLLPSILSAHEPAAALPQLQPVDVFAAWPACENMSRLPGPNLTSSLLKSEMELADACAFYCIVSCVARGYFGGFCVGLTCHCNGEEPLPTGGLNS